MPPSVEVATRGVVADLFDGSVGGRDEDGVCECRGRER